MAGEAVQLECHPYMAWLNCCSCVSKRQPNCSCILPIWGMLSISTPLARTRTSDHTHHGPDTGERSRPTPPDGTLGEFVAPLAGVASRFWMVYRSRILDGATMLSPPSLMRHVLVPVGVKVLALVGYARQEN